MIWNILGTLKLDQQLVLFNPIDKNNGWTNSPKLINQSELSSRYITMITKLTVTFIIKHFVPENYHFLVNESSKFKSIIVTYTDNPKLKRLYWGP